MDHDSTQEPEILKGSRYIRQHATPAAWFNKSLEPIAAPLSGFAPLPFRAAGSSGCGSALTR
jgi:hypothetical protein